MNNVPNLPHPDATPVEPGFPAGQPGNPAGPFMAADDNSTETAGSEKKGHSFPPSKKGRKPRPRYRATEIALIAISMVLLVTLLAILISLYALSGALGGSPSVAAGLHSPANSFAVVRVEGSIQSGGSDSLGGGYQHEATLEFVKKLAQEENNKGILLYMNTGGGGVFESDEMYRALEAY